MPLKYVRTKLTASNALSVAVATASISNELTDLLSFPPARAATGILLLIFKTIQVCSIVHPEIFPANTLVPGHPDKPK